MTQEKTQNCPITRAAWLLGDEWTLMIVKQLLDGTKRFNQLQNLLLPPNSETCISSKTLTDRLKQLESEGVLTRTLTPEVPLKVEYTLTEKGLALSKIIKDIKDFGEKYMM